MGVNYKPRPFIQQSLLTTMTGQAFLVQGTQQQTKEAGMVMQDPSDLMTREESLNKMRRKDSGKRNS